MQRVNMTKRDSSSYIGSAYTECSSDMMQIEEIKDIVAVMNKQLREAGSVDRRGHRLQYRVSLKGREAIRKENNRSYTSQGDVVGGLANSKRIDVYIHRR